MNYRVFVSDAGQFRTSNKYEFIAEFAEQELTTQYVLWMRKEKRFMGKDIIIRECEGKGINPTEGKVCGVITVMGESLPVEEYEFS